MPVLGDTVVEPSDLFTGLHGAEHDHCRNLAGRGDDPRRRRGHADGVGVGRFGDRGSRPVRTRSISILR